MPVGCLRWTPIRRVLGGLDGFYGFAAIDVALGCLLAVGCECLANGTLDRPEDAMDLAFG